MVDRHELVLLFPGEAPASHPRVIFILGESPRRRTLVGCLKAAGVTFETTVAELTRADMRTLMADLVKIMSSDPGWDWSQEFPFLKDLKLPSLPPSQPSSTTPSTRC